MRAANVSAACRLIADRRVVGWALRDVVERPPQVDLLELTLQRDGAVVMPGKWWYSNSHDSGFSSSHFHTAEITAASASGLPGSSSERVVITTFVIDPVTRRSAASNRSGLPEKW